MANSKWILAYEEEDKNWTVQSSVGKFIYISTPSLSVARECFDRLAKGRVTAAGYDKQIKRQREYYQD